MLYEVITHINGLAMLVRMPPPRITSYNVCYTKLLRIKIDTVDTSFGGDLTARFFGRGTADAGHALLVNSSGKTKRVVVSPIGRIRIEDG